MFGILGSWAGMTSRSLAPLNPNIWKDLSYGIVHGECVLGLK
jgi:hypothetical protein